MTDQGDERIAPDAAWRGAMTRRAAITRGAAFAATIGAPLARGEEYSEATAAAFGKPGLLTLSARPINLETPAHLLDDETTPAAKFFVRNNGLPPDLSESVVEAWRLAIDGAVERPLSLSIADLRAQFETVTLRLPIECAGNGRKFFTPATSGNQWMFGAVGCADWTGVRLADVLAAAGVKADAVYTAHYGADRHLSGDPSKEPISRGVPVAKALEPHTLIAWAMNGAPIPALNGHPLRLIVPGWPGSCSQKWLTRITLRTEVHDGAKMTGDSYRMPAHPLAPGSEAPEGAMRIIETLPVKSLVTYPMTGERVRAGEPFEARGSAWSGDGVVTTVDISIDYGTTWSPASLGPSPNRFSWRRWRAEITPPAPGYYEIWARAHDGAGHCQPAVPPGWNPKGYLNNMQHRIAVMAA